MKVSQKLLATGLGIILVTSFSLYFFSEYQSCIIETANRRNRIVLEMSVKSMEINIAINNFQINDIYDETYYEQGISNNLEHYKNLMQQLSDLQNKYFRVNEEPQWEKRKEHFQHLITDLNNSTENLVQAYAILGYNDYGMEADFALTRDIMEEEFHTLDETAFEGYLAYLKIQEMKFIHRKNDKYIDKVTLVLEETVNVISEKDRFREIAEIYINNMRSYQHQYSLIGLSPSEGLRGELQKSLRALDLFLHELSTESDHAIQKASSRNTFYGLLFIVTGIFLSSISFILLSRHVTVPLNDLSLSAKKIADGDLTLTINEKLTRRRDEIGLLALALHSTVENLQNTVHEIKRSSGNNKQVGETLRESAEKTSQSVEDISEKLNNFSQMFTTLDNNIARSKQASDQIVYRTSKLLERISEQVSTVEDTSTIIEQMTVSLNSIAGITSDKKKISSDLVQITREGDEKVNETNLIIQEISKNTDQMKSLTDLINGIASQTNLLSMNAAIEAAHAGEMGKGFGVVSEEIRKLSDGTARAVKEISEYLNSVVGMIEKALISSRNSGEAFARVNSGVCESSKAFSSISLMISELSTGSQDMLKAVSQIKEITKEVHSGSEEIMGVISSLGNEMKEVDDLSSRSAIEINGSLSSIETIDNNTNRVAELSSTNELIIEQLTDLITRFELSE